MKKMNKKNINYTDLPKFDKKYPKYITIPKDYWSGTPDNIVYISKCKKCKKEHKVWTKKQKHNY